MKHLLWMVLLAQCFGQEIRRPQTDVDGGAISALGCLGTNTSSFAMPLSYDGGGLATFSQSATSGSSTSARSSTRLFKSWATPGSAYSVLSLNLHAASDGWLNVGTDGRTGYAAMWYSLDGGATWVLVKNDVGGAGWLKQTFSINLSVTLDFTKLRVAVCTGGLSGSKFLSAGGDNIFLYDVWTSGTTGSSNSGNGSSSGLAARTIVVVN